MKKNHIVFGPDGNRRFALKQNISIGEAYKLLPSKLIDVVKFAYIQKDIDPITIWCLQDYNLYRSEEEVQILVEFVNSFILDLCETSRKESIDLEIELIGNKELFFNTGYANKTVIEKAIKGVNKTGSFKVNIIIGYNADYELNNALSIVSKKGLGVTFENISNNWSIPPVDLFIRTGQPNGFVNLSSYWPRIERGRLISIENYPQEFTKKDFESIYDKFINLQDSVSKVIKGKK